MARISMKIRCRTQSLNVSLKNIKNISFNINMHDPCYNTATNTEEGKNFPKLIKGTM